MDVNLSIMLCVVCMFPPRASPTDWARDRGWSLSPLPSPRQHTDNIRPGQPPAWQSQHCNIEINTSYHLLDEWWMLPILSQPMKFAHQIKTNHSNYVLSRKEVAGIKIKTKCFAVTDGIEWRCTLNSCSSSDIHWTVNNNCAMLYLNCITFTSWAAVHCKVSAAIHLQAARISLYDGFLCPAIIRLSRPYCWLVAVTRYPARWYHADTFATPHTGSGPPQELSTNLRQFSLPTSTSKIKNLFLRHLNIVSRHKLGHLSENIIAKRRF